MNEVSLYPITFLVGLGETVWNVSVILLTDALPATSITLNDLAAVPGSGTVSATVPEVVLTNATVPSSIVSPSTFWLVLSEPIVIF